MATAVLTSDTFDTILAKLNVIKPLEFEGSGFPVFAEVTEGINYYGHAKSRADAIDLLARHSLRCNILVGTIVGDDRLFFIGRT